MEDVKQNGIVDNIKEYVQTRIELATLTAVDKATQLFVTLVTNLAFIIFALLAFLFLSFGLALWISALMGNFYSGFFIIAGFYLLIAIIVQTSKAKLDKSVGDAVVKKLFKERNEDRNESKN